jgi:hypothetical protein
MCDHKCVNSGVRIFIFMTCQLSIITLLSFMDNLLALGHTAPNKKPLVLRFTLNCDRRKPYYAVIEDWNWCFLQQSAKQIRFLWFIASYQFIGTFLLSVRHHLLPASGHVQFCTQKVLFYHHRRLSRTRHLGLFRFWIYFSEIYGPIGQLVGLLGRGIGPTQGLYLYTGQYNTGKRVPRVGFGPPIPVFERPEIVRASDCSAIGTGR